MELQHVILNTPFRGNRDYVQSASIFNELQSYFKKSINSEAWIKQLKLNKLTDTCCFATTILDDDDLLLGDFLLVYFDITLTGYIVTKENMLIDSREDFDENLLCIHANIQGEGVKSSWNEKVSFIDQCVALTKYYHNQLFELEGKKWIYTRLTLSENIKDFHPESISIRLKKKLGNRITQSEVLLDHKVIGVIEFAVK